MSERAALLRPYAETQCLGPGPNTTSHELDCLGACHATGLDPRFDALRGEHEWERQDCRRCGAYNNPLTDEKPAPYCLRTDLGSIVRAAAAHGPDALDAICQAVADNFNGLQGWFTSPEEAAAGAFVAAVPLAPQPSTPDTH